MCAQQKMANAKNEETDPKKEETDQQTANLKLF